MAPYKTGNLFNIILELSKVRITVAVAFTTITGYILASRSYSPGFILPTLGIFCLACGSSVINHLQERTTDAKMVRTRNRPLPSHRISYSGAILIALAETVAGSLILYTAAGELALLLGLLAMVWYNGIYTNLKRITASAVIPGSVIGSIPPLVGWVSAGGDLLSFHAGLVALFFFVWQVPHFYLLALQYGKEYEDAGLPSITSRWSAQKARNRIFLWIILTALASLGIVLAGIPSSLISSALIIASSLFLVISFVKIRNDNEELFRPFIYFMKINYFVLAVTLILIAGPLLKNIFHI